MSTVPMPAELAEIIAAHRAMFGGWKMMADETTQADTDQAQQEQQGTNITFAPTYTQAKPSDVAKQESAEKREPAPWGEDFDAERAWKLIENLREDKAKATQAAKRASDAASEKVKAAAQALGLAPADDDPQALVKAAEESAKAEREARIRSQSELIVWRNAAELGIDPAAITDSNRFLNSVSKLDPAADDFESSVKRAAQEAAQNNPSLRAQVVRKNGAEMTGGSGEGATTAASKAAPGQARLAAAYAENHH